MKGSKMKIAAVLLAAALALGGCGDALYEMAPEEEAAVVGYAAHVVAKFNNYQTDGQVFVMQRDLEAGSLEQDTKKPDAQEPDAGQPDDQEAGNGAPQEGQDSVDLGDGTDLEASGQPAQPAGQGTSTVTEALDLGVISADYKGSSLCTTYEKSDSFAVDAQPGKQLLVLNIMLTNTSDKNLHIDILAMTPTFQVILNDGQSAKAQTTILPNDLSTYQGDILPGAANETVLLFEVPQEIQSAEGLQLKITMNGNEHICSLSGQ